jgi:hypothetical protein
MSDIQIGLFDLALKTTNKTGAEDFTDSTGSRLKNLEWQRNLPDNVLFDGRRYSWRFELKNEKVYFIEKWLPEYNEE